MDNEQPRLGAVSAAARRLCCIAETEGQFALPASPYQAACRNDRFTKHTSPAEAAVRRQVRSNGEIKWQGDLIHMCSALIGEAVGVAETEDGSWHVRFFDAPIGVIDRKTQKDSRRLGVPVHGNAEPTPPTEPEKL